LVLLLVLVAGPGARAQVPLQCKNGTLSYDISFVGPLQRLQAGAFPTLRI
jgi:hypothetical protein